MRIVKYLRIFITAFLEIDVQPQEHAEERIGRLHRFQFFDVGFGHVFFAEQLVGQLIGIRIGHDVTGGECLAGRCFDACCNAVFHENSGHHRTGHHRAA